MLVYMTFRRSIAPSSTIERLNGEIKRRTVVVGIFPNGGIVRRVGAILLEQKDEWPCNGHDP